MLFVVIEHGKEKLNEFLNSRQLLALSVKLFANGQWSHFTLRTILPSRIKTFSLFWLLFCWYSVLVVAAVAVVFAYPQGL